MGRARSAKKKAEYEAELNGPEFPLALSHVWSAFMRLHARRGSNGFSINPISWPEIDAFLRHSRVSLAPWELRLIEELDGLYLAEQATKKE